MFVSLFVFLHRTICVCLFVCLHRSIRVCFLHLLKTKSIFSTIMGVASLRGTRSTPTRWRGYGSPRAASPSSAATGYTVASRWASTSMTMGVESWRRMTSTTTASQESRSGEATGIEPHCRHFLFVCFFCCCFLFLFLFCCWFFNFLIFFFLPILQDW